VVKDAKAATPPAEDMPTEGEVDRGHAPETEHEPGGDL
jgi:hypothetical protein